MNPRRLLASILIFAAVWFVVGWSPWIATARAEENPSRLTITPSPDDKEIYDLYQRLTRDNKPQLITTDLALHTAHLLFDYSLRAVESEHLFEQAKRLTMAMARESEFQEARRADTGPLVAGYFAVAARLLDPTYPVPVGKAKAVEADLALIAAHQGGAYSAVLDSAEDFSQYVPRGHYTRNDDFRKYFQAMTWYGRRMFRVEESRPGSVPPPLSRDHWSDDHRRQESLMMLKIVWMLDNVKIDGEPAAVVWERLYKSTMQFAGKAEDLTPEQIRVLAGKVWGRLPAPEDLGRLPTAEVDQFARLASEQTHPKVDSSGTGRKGFCFMAQRFTPDSYVMQSLVTDADQPFGGFSHPLAYTGRREPRPFTWGSNRYLKPPERRFMPRGLDVMAVLGSTQAATILLAEGDADYAGYHDLANRLSREVTALRREHADESLYYAWLDVLSTLCPIPESKNIPEVFRSEDWARKELMTALAAWTELRHDTQLYVKQSYTPTKRAMPPREAQVYVEPYPEVYARLGQLVSKMRQRIQALKVLPEPIDRSYTDFVRIMEELEKAARAEAAGTPLSPAALRSLKSVAARLKTAVQLPKPMSEKLLGAADSQMALVTDVHTDANAGQVLQQAVGAPLRLSVTLPFQGKQVNFEGGMMSYYEFKQPMADRLTDEAWQSRLTKPEKRPPLPAWCPGASAKDARSAK